MFDFLPDCSLSATEPVPTGTTLRVLTTTPLFGFGAPGELAACKAATDVLAGIDDPVLPATVTTEVATPFLAVVMKVVVISEFIWIVSGTGRRWESAALALVTCGV